MATREILVLGDERLRRKAKKIRRFDESLQALVDDMFETMYAVNGLGLAATQIGVPLRLAIIEMPAVEDESGEVTVPKRTFVLCNPEIVKATREEEVTEACLSVPGYMGKIMRARDVLVKAQDLRGRRVRYRGQDLLAQKSYQTPRKALRQSRARSRSRGRAFICRHQVLAGLGQSGHLWDEVSQISHALQDEVSARVAKLVQLAKPR